MQSKRNGNLVSNREKREKCHHISTEINVMNIEHWISINILCYAKNMQNVQHYIRNSDIREWKMGKIENGKYLPIGDSNNKAIITAVRWNVFVTILKLCWHHISYCGFWLLRVMTMAFQVVHILRNLKYFVIYSARLPFSLSLFGRVRSSVSVFFFYF